MAMARAKRGTKKRPAKKKKVAKKSGRKTAARKPAKKTAKAKKRTTKKVASKRGKATKKSAAKRRATKKATRARATTRKKVAAKKKTKKSSAKKKKTKKVSSRAKTKSTKKKSASKARAKKATKKTGARKASAKKTSTKKTSAKRRSAAKKSAKASARATRKEAPKKKLTAKQAAAQAKAAKAAAKKAEASARKRVRTPDPNKPVAEERYFQAENVYMCILINRRTQSARVIDFRAGPLPAKRLFLQSMAVKEGIQKIVTLVEKDEVSTWTRVGFVREGTIPGFYKRSDGHLCGCVISDKTASIAVTDAGQRLAERTINAAKKHQRNIPKKARATVRKVDRRIAEKARDKAWKEDLGLGSFDPFGRDADEFFFETKYKKSVPNYIRLEFQDCFGHSLVEVLRIPKNIDEIVNLAAGLNHINELLTERGIVSGFVLAPIDNVEISASLLATGYRKTGILAEGCVYGGERHDAILWTRKLANPLGEDASDDD